MSYTLVTTEEFDKWLDRLADAKAKGAITERLIRVQSGLFGDTDTVGNGVSELRVHVGPGYRVYYTIRGRIVIVILCGGAKNSQQRDIKRAKMLAEQVWKGAIP